MTTKNIIAGSRTITNYNELILALTGAINANIIPHADTFEIVSGGAIGVDTLARRYAIESGYKLTEMKAHLSLGPNDRYAALRRNRDIANYGDILIAIWDGQSRSTNDIIEYTKKLGKPVYIHYVK